MRPTAGLRGRRAIGAIATVAAAAAATSLAVPAMAASAAPAARILSAGQVGTRSAVPWNKVGPGWALATFSANVGGEGVKPEDGPTTLYLVDPQGGRYNLKSWAGENPGAHWSLIGWSGDVSKALFVSAENTSSGIREHVYQLQVRSGHVSGFTLPAGVNAVSYTRPDGVNILAEKWTSTAGSGTISVRRYNLRGKLQQDLASVNGLGLLAGRTGIPPVPYNSAGTELVAGSTNGLELISNAGGVIRALPVPQETEGCTAVRWWSPTTALASCSVPNGIGPQLWLVPVNGARPTALTPVRTGNSFDLGDFNSWQLSSGLYLDGYGGCGSLVIGRQPAHGREQQVNVRGSGSSLIVNATRSSLMVERINGCAPGVSLVWFNPATRKMTVAIPVSHHKFGVTAVVPYFINGKY